MKRILRPLAIFFALSAIGLAGYYYWALPAKLRVAVGPKEAEQVRFIGALADALVDGDEPVRLVPIIVDGSIGASSALEERKVELAVVRSDDLTSKSARAVAVLHRRAIVIIGRPDRVKSFADLRGKRLISVRGATDSNKALVKSVLSHFGILHNDDNLPEASISDAETALVQKKADALVLVAPPAGRGIRNLVANLGKAKVPFSFIDLPAAEAVALRFPYLQTMSVPAGVFGGSPPRPPGSLDTVSISYELVASRLLSERTVALLTKVVLAARPKNYLSDGGPFFVEAPPTDQIRRYMPHDGTKAFLGDRSQTFLEAYSDHIWLALFGFSLVGSSITGFLIWMGVRKRPESDERIHDLPALVDRISSAQTLSELDAVQKDFDKVLKISVQDYATGALDESEDIDRPFWLEQVQSLIQRRYDKLREAHGSALAAGHIDQSKRADGAACPGARPQ